MVLIVAAVVLFRFLFGIGSIAAQESIIYVHAALFMLCLGFTLQQDAHVRVDVFYHRFSAHTRAWINVLGAILFLLPFAIFIILISYEFVGRAWSIQEGSPDPGGLPFIYLLKTLIPFAGTLLTVQAIGQIFASLSVILQPDEANSD